MGNSNKPVIDEDDVELLKAINRHGFIDMNYICKFYKNNCKHDTAKRRIKQLVKHRYLHEEKMFEPKGFTLSGRDGYSAFCLDREGLNFMRFLGYEAPNNVAMLTKAAPYRIYHQVQVATVCDSIELAYRKKRGRFEVDQILNEREATLTEQENQPDAMLLFKHTAGNQGLIAVFVELERSYARWQRIDAKICAYHNVIKSNKYLQELKLPIVAYRILFVAQTDSQFNTLKAKISLCANINNVEVLIARYKDVCTKSCEEVYESPILENKYKLLSNLTNAKLNEEENKT